MKKILLTLAVWKRARQAARRHRALLADLRDQIAELEERLDLAILAKETDKGHYENLLSFEREKVWTLTKEWSDRFLQLQKLTSLNITTSLLSDNALEAVLPEYRQVPKEEGLTADQLAELESRREFFYSEGFKLNKSPAEVHSRWKDIEHQVILEVKSAIL